MPQSLAGWLERHTTLVTVNSQLTGMSDGDTKLLSFGDVLLRKSDVELLRTPNWLNDQIIAFHFEYLSREKYADMQQVVSFMSGATTFLLLNAGPISKCDELICNHSCAHIHHA